MKKNILVLTTVIILSAQMTACANAPIIKSNSPVIYLADNLDEKDKLGWCIDTEGRGFADKLQSHSCKPARGRALDTQFSYHKKSGQIRSVSFSGKCMALNKPEDKVWPFGLIDCAEDDMSQKFMYDAKSQEIQIGDDTSQCVVVAPNSIVAGPFMSRDLIYADCKLIEKKYKQWIIEQ